MEGQEKEKQIVKYSSIGGEIVAAFFVGGFFMKIIFLSSVIFSINFSINNFQYNFNQQDGFISR